MMILDNNEQKMYLSSELVRLRAKLQTIPETDALYPHYVDYIRKIEEFIGDNNGQTVINDMLTTKKELTPKYDLAKILGITDEKPTGFDIKNHIGNGLSISRLD